MIFYKGKKFKKIITDIKMSNIKLPAPEIIELSFDSKTTDWVTRFLYAIYKGIYQYKKEKEMTAPPAWKKILNLISNIAQFALSIWVKSKGVVLFK